MMPTQSNMMHYESSSQFSFVNPSISCIIAPTNNRGGLYLGNISSALQPTLNDNNITAVISVVQLDMLQNNLGNPQKNSYIKKHLHVSADDNPNFNLNDFFQSSNDFIEQNLVEIINQYVKEHTNVLVHCFAGISRSATLVIAFIMKKNQWSVKESYNFVWQCRKYIRPNEGFMRQLNEYHKNINDQMNK